LINHKASLLTDVVNALAALNTDIQKYNAAGEVASNGTTLVVSSSGLDVAGCRGAIPYWTA